MVCSWSFCFHVTPKPTCSTEPRRAVRVLQQVLFSMQACIAHIFEIAKLQEMAGGCTITPLRGVSNHARGSCQHWLYHHVCLSQPDHGTHVPLLAGYSPLSSVVTSNRDKRDHNITCQLYGLDNGYPLVVKNPP